MARFDYRTLSLAERQQLVGELVEVMEAVTRKKDLQSFFLQLVTPSEAVMLARRWQVAKRLASGQSYRAISADLKIGMSTITTVDQWLSDTIGDYRAQLEAAQKKAPRRFRREYVDAPDTFNSIRHRYSLPFLLVNLLIAVAEDYQLEKLRSGNT